MSINVDPNAAHACYSPSSAHRWTVCTASATAIAALGEQEEGEEAAEGTRAYATAAQEKFGTFARTA